MRQRWRAPGVLCALLATPGIGCDGATDDTDPTPDPGEVVWAEAFDTSGAGSLSGVWGTGPDDVWVVGGSDAGGEIHHFDGATWSEAALPAGVSLLAWAWGFGPDDVYAVGLDGSVVHYDGSAWSTLDSGTTDDLWGVFGFAPDDLWIVGGTPDQGEPVALHYDGATFTPRPVDPGQNSRAATALFKVWGIDGDIYAVGQRGLILEWDSGAWVERFAGPEADQDFVSLWGTSADHIVAVGGRSSTRIATFDGASWTTSAESGYGGLNAVYMTSPDVAHIGGVYGFVGTFDPASGAIAQETSLGSDDVHAMWSDGAGRTYAVGGTFRDPHRGFVSVRTVQ